jgi:hypothetical protein
MKESSPKSQIIAAIAKVPFPMIAIENSRRYILFTPFLSKKHDRLKN